MFIKNTITSIFGTGLNMIVQGLYFILLARGLGPKEFGAYVAVLALSRLFGAFASWGYGHILVKNASRDPGKFRAYWGVCLLITIMGGMVFTLLVLAISKAFLRLSIPLAAIILISFSEIVLGRIVTICQQAYQALEKMNRYVQFQTGASISKLLGAILMILMVQAPTVLSWSVLYFIAGMFPSIFGIILVNRELGRYSFGMKIIKGEILEGLYFSVSEASQTIDNDIDKTLLARMTSLDITGLYGAAYRIIDFSFIPIRGLLISAYANYFKRGTDGIRGSLKWALKLIPWSASYGLLASILLFSMAKFVPYFLGSAYNGTVNILKWLSPIIFFKSIQNLTADILTGSGHQNVRAGIHGGIAFVNISLNVWLIPIYGWLGAALASIASDGLAVIFFTISVLILLRKQKNG